MLGCTSWILEVALRERSSLNSNAACNGGVGIFISHKCVKLVTTHGVLCDNRVVWIQLEDIKGETLGMHRYMHPTLPPKDDICSTS